MNNYAIHVKSLTHSDQDTQIIVLDTDLTPESKEWREFYQRHENAARVHTLLGYVRYYALFGYVDYLGNMFENHATCYVARPKFKKGLPGHVAGQGLDAVLDHVREEWEKARMRQKVMDMERQKYLALYMRARKVLDAAEGKSVKEIAESLTARQLKDASNLESIFLDGGYRYELVFLDH